MRRSIVAASLALLLGGCTHLTYYAQAIQGHMRLMAAMRPIPEILTDQTTDAGLRRQLGQISEIREFASRQLALPDNDSYRSYADLGRPYVVWNVFAAPEFAVELERWCMVMVGCVNYRGYYDKNDAERYAAELRQAGADTYVGGVAAYSTLGYFSDPVLNTFLRFGDLEVARVVFHELAHQVAFAADDSVFNESFATAVENEGMRRWIAHAATPEQFTEFETKQLRKAQFQQLLTDAREQLRLVYASALVPDAKRRAKAETIAAMKRAYADLKTSWGGYAGYDPWISQPLNNAALGTVTLYTQRVPAFRALLDEEGGDLPRFYGRVAALARLSKAERSAALDQLMTNRIAAAPLL